MFPCSLAVESLPGDLKSGGQDFGSSSYWCFPICYEKGIFGYSRQAINDTCRQQAILLDSETVVKDSLELPWL